MLALYLYGSLARGDFAPTVSDINLWLCIRPETDLQRVRESFLPLWGTYGHLLKRGPVVTRPEDCLRFEQLFPNQASSIRAEARLLAGSDVWRDLAPANHPDELEQLAEVALEALRCSWILSPAVRTAHGMDQARTGRRLGQLVRRALGSRPVSDGPAAESLVAIHHHLSQARIRFPAYDWDEAPPVDSPPPLLPDLVALVALKSGLIVVLPRLDHPTLVETDWTTVAKLVADEFDYIMVATPWQLRLAFSVELAEDTQLRAYEHIWGRDLVGSCQPERHHLARSTAALPVRILVDELPARYLTTPEEELAELVHDLQNNLANIQLRQEIWARVMDGPARQPPEALPGRETPIHQRVAANIRCLRWWADTLTSQVTIGHGATTGSDR